jgi:hypothetical protein
MSKISLEGNVSGSGTLTIAAPNTNSNFTLSLPTNTGTIITQNSTPAFASTIGVGGATAAASGAGITFPATQSASSDVNTLDDYEEGTWTPVLQNFTVSGTFTANAKYTKIGNLVTVRMTQTGGTITGSSANAHITGLPFQPDLTNGGAGAFTNGSPNISGTVLIYGVSGGQLWIAVGITSQVNFQITATYFI